MRDVPKVGTGVPKKGTRINIDGKDRLLPGMRHTHLDLKTGKVLWEEKGEHETHKAKN